MFLLDAITMFDACEKDDSSKTSLKTMDRIRFSLC